VSGRADGNVGPHTAGTDKPGVEPAHTSPSPVGATPNGFLEIGQTSMSHKAAQTPTQQKATKPADPPLVDTDLKAQLAKAAESLDFDALAGVMAQVREAATAKLAAIQADREVAEQMLTECDQRMAQLVEQCSGLGIKLKTRKYTRKSNALDDSKAS